jgi:alpha/beta superfamily hydrolase
MERSKSVTFPSAGGQPIQLQGEFHWLGGEVQWPAVVVCHPHPLGGGTMRNAVVTTISRALVSRGVLALRFNFRGVGRSGGRHDNGRGERADVAGALDWLLDQPQVDPWRVGVVGYSFGAWVGLSHAQEDPRVAAVGAVALVPWREDVDFYQAVGQLSRQGASSQPGGAWQFAPDFLQSFTRPKLFVSGEQDSFAPSPLLEGLVDRLPPPKELHLLPGTDHFLMGREGQVGDLVSSFFADL